jgi:hypothetical protein
MEIEPVANVIERVPNDPAHPTQQALTSAGQRKVNLIWEVTQAGIAISVVVTTLYVAAYMVIRGKPEQQLPTIFAVAFGTIVGFYFGRTNHSAVGGVGEKGSYGSEGR